MGESCLNKFLFVSW